MVAFNSILFTTTSPVTDEEFDRYYQFRWQQLRQPLQFPLGSERDQYEADAYHRMALDQNNQIIGVGRIHLQSKTHAQIRYMATTSAMQRHGVGSAILIDLLEYAAQQNIKICWLKSRASVCAFYQTHGFEITGPAESELPIPHVRMEKPL